ncbi:MAG: LLM class flavin-dependent oxidoreductase, partial [Myxococcota bacterium]|nr:LLM class flavin-dependent oxidoreductase [Myxococcota bacterium]
MRFSFWLPVDETWPEMRARALRLADEGWQGLWVADNLLPRREPGGELLEAWSSLAALAATVPGMGLGSLVSSNTYRHPALLAKIAATVERIATGPVTLGLGAGWRPRDHEATGIPLPPKDVRRAMLAEALAMLRELLDGRSVTRDGPHYRPVGLTLNPLPTRRIALLLGARSADLAARFADAWHVWDPPEAIGRRRERLARRCEAIDRDPGAIRILASPPLLIGNDRALVERLRRDPE